MLKLTKKTDYALMALHFMANQGEDIVANTRAISELYNIPLELLAKILQRLVNKRIIINQNPAISKAIAKSKQFILLQVRA